MAQYTAIIRSAPSTPPPPGADQNHSDTRHLPHYHKEGPAAMVHRTPVFRFALLTVGIVGMFLLLDGSQWAFSQFVSLPPYFRFLLLVNLGVWCWATNVHGLSVSGIDVARLMDDGTGNTHQHRRVGGGVDEETDDDDGDDKPSSGMDKFYIPIYGVAAGLTGVTIVSMLVFLKFAEKWGEERAEFVPALTYLLLVVLVCWPYKGFFAQERSAFRRSLKRTVVDGFGSAVPFCDVILADILTSFAKIMGDLQIVFADFVTNESISSTTVTSVLAAPNIAASRMTFQAFDFVSPLLICLPYLFRLRQCIAEYTQTPKPAVRRRHLANSLKYLSALPVVMSGFTINWMEARYHRRYGGGLLEGGKEDQEHSRVLESTRHGLNAAIGYWYGPVLS
ncbi:hypothetical protein PhCBS80983_g01788 [Powellomyces hirtus]|uniref:EXS domain-containing protein n=1 Tax=Powellomyces hirtus TaxID=109895 RepID=A0A507EAJ8_9FUNG|nr:hypothetical protein PhCBS80983_g01788 [Powellomyces hirtus]